ncbi:MAG: ABC transporter permease subunit [Clostridia bacterium]|nr:ABC transporter permease subunit [Clostridia bacterium]
MKPQKSFFRKLDRAGTILYPLAFGVLVFILLQTGALQSFMGVDEFVLPRPSSIGSIISGNLPKVMLNVRATLIASLGGLFLGSLLGYFIAVIATVFTKWGAGGLSIVAAFNAIPIVALAPVITNWTKDVSSNAEIRSMAAKIIVVMLMCTATMSINAYRGLTELKPFSKDLLESYAAKKLTIFVKLRLPNSVPYIFTALRVSVPLSVISAIVSEYFAEFIIGVGRQIRENIVLAQYTTAWAYITAACLIGVILYALLILLESIFLRHRI